MSSPGSKIPQLLSDGLPRHGAIRRPGWHGRQWIWRVWNQPRSVNSPTSPVPQDSSRYSERFSLWPEVQCLFMPWTSSVGVPSCHENLCQLEFWRTNVQTGDMSDELAAMGISAIVYSMPLVTQERKGEVKNKPSRLGNSDFARLGSGCTKEWAGCHKSNQWEYIIHVHMCVCMCMYIYIYIYICI